ncbi:MAG: hypothetical protein OXU20_40000 [Myxococcales bacterium]|nr:hypothetical protein [Myxococcales bacterium]MDD9966746.1 hypothetical protein [Myxococcales bacterium]
MSTLAKIDIPELDTATLEIVNDGRVRLSGTIAAQSPASLLRPCFQAIHEAALRDGCRQLEVDVQGLTFVNSSSIRLFIDWAMWIQALEEDRRYLLRFLTHPDITWQNTSFAAIKTIVGDVVSIEAQAA